MLYYPHINAPTPVIAQALMYWDCLSTIVPPDFDAYLSRSMRRLNEAGFYKPIEGDLIWGPRCSLEGDLPAALRSAPLDDLLPSDRNSAGEPCVLYAAKLGADLTKDLIDRGLAEELEPDGRYRRLRVSHALQLTLLSLAARSYATSINNRDGCTALTALRPFTDERYAFAASRAAGEHYDVDRENACWEVEIGELMPVPRDDTTIADLFAFRERYHDERRRLLLAVDLLLHGLCRQYDSPKDVLRVLEAELSAALADLESAARASRVSFVRRSVAVVVSIGTAGVALRLPSAAWVLGVVGGFAINIATTTVRDSNFNSPYAEYIYLLRVNQFLTR